MHLALGFVNHVSLCSPDHSTVFLVEENAFEGKGDKLAFTRQMY